MTPREAPADASEAQTEATSEVPGQKVRSESPEPAAAAPPKPYAEASPEPAAEASPELEPAESPASAVTGASAAEETDSTWPDIADEVDELAFFISQGFEDDARFTFMDLDQRHPGHPALEPFRVKFSSGVVLDAPVESPSDAGGQPSESTETATEAPAELSNGAEDSQPEQVSRSGNANDDDIGETEQATIEDPANASDTEVAHVASGDSSDSSDTSAVGSQEIAVGADPAQPVAEVDNSDVSQQAASDTQEVAFTATEDPDAPLPESADEPVSSTESPGSEPDFAATSNSATQLTQDSAAAYMDPDAEEEASATGGEQDQVSDAREKPEPTRPGESPEDALDGLARADELEREAENPEPEPEPEPEFEDFMLGDEDLEGDDFLTSIFAPPEESSSAPTEDVKVPARARATIDASADARTLFDLGTAYREMGLVDDAITQFEMAAQDPAWTARSLVMMASLHLHRGETDKATADLEEAIGCASNDAERSEASYELGVVYQMVGNNAKARELFEAVGPGYRDRDERLASLKA